RARTSASLVSGTRWAASSSSTSSSASTARSGPSSPIGSTCATGTSRSGSRTPTRPMTGSRGADSPFTTSPPPRRGFGSSSSTTPTATWWSSSAPRGHRGSRGWSAGRSRRGSSRTRAPSGEVALLGLELLPGDLPARVALAQDVERGVGAIAPRVARQAHEPAEAYREPGDHEPPEHEHQQHHDQAPDAPHAPHSPHRMGGPPVPVPVLRLRERRRRRADQRRDRPP